jgi:hypothetical protein
MLCPLFYTMFRKQAKRLEHHPAPKATAIAAKSHTSCVAIVSKVRNYIALKQKMYVFFHYDI